MTAATATKEKPEPRLQPVSGVDSIPDQTEGEGVVTIIMAEPMTTGQQRALEKGDPVEFHYSWCDPAHCYRDDMWGDGLERGVVHLSAPATWDEQGGRPASAHVQRWRADWSEDESPLVVVIDPPDALSLPLVREFSSWLSGLQRHFCELITPKPPATPCPDWCTAESSDEERVRGDHQWGLWGVRYRRAPGQGEHIRIHFGIVGKTYREQVEYALEDGTTELGRRIVLGLVRPSGLAR
ncbi:hypothetical protein CWIS_04910 [Cellulomonas sp. A375-1]|uniref:hypothetical protein n=1 Tax=Cellulomonas sp. A375-1 TaxID=1672219 RepID=UPI0006527232|nr:hypothetical protein [Cellulomonas sp. A375-1]KMM46482.1 hypothetical protein CWIS_04910 [Cellulomonas sp. A375-1]